MTDGGPYRLFKTTVIPQVTEVRVYEETLLHIEEYAMELPAFWVQIENGLTLPSRVYLDNQGRNSYVFMSTQETYNQDPIHLPVVMVNGTSGRLATAYFTDPDYKGTVVWSASNE